MTTQDVANRCIEWMNDVIALHLDMTYNDPHDEHLEAIEDAEFIIESIKKRINEVE